NFVPGGSDILFKYNDFEIQIQAPPGFTGSCVGFVACGSQTLSGIFDVITLSNALGTTVYWTTGTTDGTQLNGTFQGLQVQEIVQTGSGFDIYFAGGTATIYNVPNGSYDPTAPPAGDAQVCGGPCPSPWLTLNFSPGIVAADNPATLGFDESTTTLFSQVSALTSPFTGSGHGNLVATGGTAFDTFNLNFSLGSQLSSCSPPPSNPQFAALCSAAGSWPIASFDPLIGRTVPEPATLALLGLGVLGMAVLRRRRT
ncbi:MAG TPA: PEP-CTERM sorting domain-containing protein, partial [Casimicrobiaceae bacterium]|nr:PEP-CTERM sorting domain-containing protein [Casimicrobiaceae bacterium]